MARRNDHTRQELHDNLINAAREIIIAEGLENLTARKLATRIGYAVGTIYNVFQNLTDVILHVNRQTLEELTQQIIATHPHSDDPLQNLIAFADTYIDFSRKNEKLWRATFDLIMPEDEKHPEWTKTAALGLLYLIAEQLTDRVEDQDKRMQAALALWAGVHGLCILESQRKLETMGMTELHEMSHLHVTSFYKGLKG
ncbi:MAG: TetR-like C-terminal domain-containing protein [Alphaproteobacteria bacterium]